MEGGFYMKQLRPLTDLSNTEEISELCRATHEPLLFKGSGGDLVVMSVETYEELLETSQIDTAIGESEEEYSADGVLLDAREALDTLRRKYFG